MPAAEREELLALVASGKAAARKIRCANILLMSDGRAHLDKDIATALSVGTSTVYRTKRRWVEEGLDVAIHERHRRGGLREPDAKAEAFLIATACTDPPQGCAQWTLSLQADEVVACTEVESLSTETVRRRLRDNKLNPASRRCGASRRSAPTSGGGGVHTGLLRLGSRAARNAACSRNGPLTGRAHRDCRGGYSWLTAPGGPRGAGGGTGVLRGRLHFGFRS